MSTPTKHSDDLNSATFRTHRVLPYSREQIFQAFARPELLERWWGPRGYTNTFEVFEFQPGGRWKYVMHGPNGNNPLNESVFLNVDAPSSLVIHHISQPRYILTVTLEDHEDKTMITWNQEFEDIAVADRIRHIVEPANEQNLDKLESVLAGE